jgi:dihydrolipoamide dehydrogenase
MAYDVVVIGTGPGGYVCAIKAAQLGLRTAVVEKQARFGGTCLNIGCIPSKALLHTSELFSNLVIATGSDVAGIPGVEVTFDEKTVVSSTGALELAKVPARLVVVGGGVIGLELGSVWARLGAKVTVIEFLDMILGGMDGEIAKQFRRLLEKQGMEIRTGAKVTGVKKTSKGATVTFEPVKGGEAETVEADVVLVATGRKPYSDGLGLENAGVVMDERGRVRVDGQFSTSVQGIYAIGDVIAGPMLAHKAEDEGAAVAEIIAGQAGHVNYNVIPSVVYTEPEVASVGKTEEELKAAGTEYKASKFPFSANGRARAMLATDGFVKILADKANDRVLGVHIVGKGAGEMIHEAAVLMEFGGSSEDLGRTCHAHPTMSEAVREAALGAFAKPIHI